MLDEILIFLVFFVFPVLGLCTIPALLMGGAMLKMVEKNKEDQAQATTLPHPLNSLKTQSRPYGDTILTKEIK